MCTNVNYKFTNFWSKFEGHKSTYLGISVSSRKLQGPKTINVRMYSFNYRGTTYDIIKPVQPQGHWVGDTTGLIIDGCVHSSKLYSILCTVISIDHALMNWHLISKHFENSPFLILFQLCIEILDSLKEGKFGPEGVAAAADYQKKCALHFKMSSIFSESSEVNTSSHLNNNGNTAETDSTSEALSKMAISGSSPQLKTESTAVTSASWKEKTILLVHFLFFKNTHTPKTIVYWADLSITFAKWISLQKKPLIGSTKCFNHISGANTFVLGYLKSRTISKSSSLGLKPYNYAYGFKEGLIFQYLDG